MRKRYQKQIEHRLLLPILQFTQREKSSGIVLAVFVVLALLLANSPLRSDYLHFLEHHFGFIVDGKSVLNFSVAHWINDGLMSMFFFVVGLELKREFIGGELRDLRKVTLPVVAAVFGMLVPALIYLLFNLGTPFSHGWGNTHGHGYCLCFGRIIYGRRPHSSVSKSVSDHTCHCRRPWFSGCDSPFLYLKYLVFESCSGHLVPRNHVCRQPIGHQKRMVLWTYRHRRCMAFFPHFRYTCHHFCRTCCHGYTCRLAHF